MSLLSAQEAQEYPQDEDQDYANDRKKHMTGGIDDPLRAGGTFELACSSLMFSKLRDSSVPDPVHTIEFKEKFEVRLLVLELNYP